MREIKCRVWTGNTMLYINPRAELQLNIGINDGWSLWNIEGEICSHEKGELMLCTGLKDKNGKEIWEGDVIKTINSDWGVIVWKAPFFEVTVSETQSCTYSREFFDGCEVIGNFYENPELLEDPHD